MVDRVTRYFAIATFFLSLSIGGLDYAIFGGTVSSLSSAAAIATVIAFLSMVLLEELEDYLSPELARQLTEGALIAAVALDALKILSLAFGFPNPKYAVKLIYFVFGYLEIKDIKVFAVKPFKIPPSERTVTSLVIDPTPILALWYLYSCKRDSLVRFLKSLFGT